MVAFPSPNDGNRRSGFQANVKGTYQTLIFKWMLRVPSYFITIYTLEQSRISTDALLLQKERDPWSQATTTTAAETSIRYSQADLIEKTTNENHSTRNKSSEAREEKKEETSQETTCYYLDFSRRLLFERFWQMTPGVGPGPSTGVLYITISALRGKEQ